MHPLVSFYQTFGYVVVRGAFDAKLIDQVRAAYDATITAETGKTIAQYLADPPKPVLGGLESSQDLMDFILNSRVLQVVDDLIGDDAVFCGSDLSIFQSPSKFHRDAFGDYALLKVGIYLQDSTVKDGGQFVCIPGSHQFGDQFAARCSNGLLWPRKGGYAANAFAGEIDFTRNLMLGNMPAVALNVVVGDAIVFNPSLVHAVPATNRVRRMIALLFFEGEKSFHSRPRVPGEFNGLSHGETLAALRMAFYECERGHGRQPRLHYHPKLAELKIGALAKCLRSFTDEYYAEINQRVLGNSFAGAYKFITQQDPP
jgi:ectoine hydroxylase-related dioxygenase (phytanoyl-CoA dioxygenase family)